MSEQQSRNWSLASFTSFSLFLLDLYADMQYNLVVQCVESLSALSSQGFYTQATLVLSAKIGDELTVHRGSYLGEVRIKAKHGKGVCMGLSGSNLLLDK